MSAGTPPPRDAEAACCPTDANDRSRRNTPAGRLFRAPSVGMDAPPTAGLRLALRRADNLETGWLFGDVFAIFLVLLDGTPVAAGRSAGAVDEHFGRAVVWRSDSSDAKRGRAASSSLALSIGLDATFVSAMTLPTRTTFQMQMCEFEWISAAVRGDAVGVVVCVSAGVRGDTLGEVCVISRRPLSLPLLLCLPLSCDCCCCCCDATAAVCRCAFCC